MNEGADPCSSPNVIPMINPAIHSIRHAIYDFLGGGVVRGVRGGGGGGGGMLPKP